MNLQLHASTGDLWDLLEVCVEVATLVTPTGRAARILTTANKVNKARRIMPLAKPRLPKVPSGRMTPHEAGRFGVELALATLKTGYKQLGREIRLLGKGEVDYTICDLVMKTGERVICVEVKYGSGRFSENQLHYHRRKNVSGHFVGRRAEEAGLSSPTPRTVWMKQMCFADGALVTCKLE